MIFSFKVMLADLTNKIICKTMEFSQFSLIHAKHFLILQKIRTAKLSKEILI